MNAARSPGIGTRLKQAHEDFIARIKADGVAVTEIKCPHCKQPYEVAAIPETDSLMTCPECGELFFKYIDAKGVAHASLPEYLLDAMRLTSCQSQGGAL
jgi:phage FluMu protein Com